STASDSRSTPIMSSGYRPGRAERSGPARRGSVCSRSVVSPAASTSPRPTRSWANPTRWRVSLPPVRRLLVLMAAMLVAALATPPAAAQVDNESRDAVVVIVGDVLVGPDREVESVYLVNGHARIAGRVSGDVVVFDGDVVLSGRIDGN